MFLTNGLSGEDPSSGAIELAILLLVPTRNLMQQHKCERDWRV